MGKKKSKKTKKKSGESPSRRPPAGQSVPEKSALVEVLEIVSDVNREQSGVDGLCIIDKLRARLEQKSANIKSLNESLAAVESEQDALLTTNRDLLGKNKELNLTLTQCATLYESLVQQHADLQRERDQNDSVKSGLQKKNSALQRQLRHMSQQAMKQQAVVKQLSADSKEHQSKAKVLSRELQGLQAMEQENAGLKKTVAQLSVRLAPLTDQQAWHGVSHQFHFCNRQNVALVNQTKVLLSPQLLQGLTRLLTYAYAKGGQRYRLFMVGSAVPGSPYQSVLPADVDINIFCADAAVTFDTFFSQVRLAFAEYCGEDEVVLDRNDAFGQIVVRDQANGLTIDLNHKANYVSTNQCVFESMAQDFPINPLCVELVLNHRSQVVFGSLFHFSGVDDVLDVCSSPWFELRNTSPEIQERDALKKFACLVKLLSRALFGVNQQTYRLSDRLVQHIRCLLTATVATLSHPDINFIRVYWRLVDSMLAQLPACIKISTQIKQTLDHLLTKMSSYPNACQRLAQWLPVVTPYAISVCMSPVQQSMLTTVQRSRAIAVSPLSKRSPPPGFGLSLSTSPG